MEDKDWRGKLEMERKESMEGPASLTMSSLAAEWESSDSERRRSVGRAQRSRPRFSNSQETASRLLFL